MTSPKSSKKEIAFTANAAAVHALEEAVAAEVDHAHKHRKYGNGEVDDTSRGGYDMKGRSNRKHDKGPKGRWLQKSDGITTIDIEASPPGEEQHELPVTPITRVASLSQPNVYIKQAAVNDEFIAYGLKQGHIRVLHRFSESRALLKGHSGPIADIAIVSDQQNTVIAAGGQDGKVYAWRIVAKDGENSIHAEEVVCAKFSPGCENSFVYLSMAKIREKVILACAIANSVLVLPIPEEGDAKLDPEIDPLSPDPPVYKMPNFPPQDAPTAVQLLNINEDKDGCFVMAGSKHGRIYLAQVESSEGKFKLLEKTEVTAGDEINQLHAFSINSNNAAWSVIASSSQGTRQSLFSFDKNVSKLCKQHDVILQSNSKSFIQVDVVPQKNLIVAVDSTLKSVYTLHLGDNQFNYFAKFKVSIPILNFCAYWDPDRADIENGAVELTCIQKDAVQQYVIDSDLCWSEVETDGDEDLLSDGIKGSEEVLEPAKASSTSTLTDNPSRDSSKDQELVKQPSLFAPSQEECPSPPPSPSAPAVTVQVPVPLTFVEEASESKDKGSGSGSTTNQKLLTPRDLLKTNVPSTEDKPRKSSLTDKSQSTHIKLLKRPVKEQPVMARGDEIREAAEVSESREVRSNTDDMPQMHQTMLVHLSAMHKEMLRAMKTELSSQSAAAQAANAALLREALQAQAMAIQKERAAILAEERKGMERLLSSISNVLNKDLPQRLSDTLRTEMEPMVQHISASLIATLERSLSSMLSQESSQAIKTALDTNLAGAVNSAFSKSLQDSFRQAFVNQIVPRFEQASQSMFTQIDRSFNQGLQEYLFASKNMISESTGLAAQLRESLELAKSFSHQGHSTSFTNSGIGSYPLANNPADIKSELRSLVSKERYEQAFSMALGLQDVRTVAWLCTLVDAATVLSGNSPLLSQMVLLSLIQQLSSDMQNNPTVKLQWIREAAMVLNPKDPLLGPHLTSVLQQVHENLSNALQHLHGADMSSCKLAMHVVHSQMTSL